MSLQSTDFVVAFTPGRVYAALVGPPAGGLVQLGAGGLSNRRITSFLNIDPTDGRSKVWAVDGEAAVIVSVDVEENVVTGGAVESWASAVAGRGVGTLPEGCALCADYLGRAVLARPEIDPSNYFMSRTGNPLDWGYTLDPQATTPVAGRNSKAGVPGDAIIGLIGGWDDNLVFGCASSMWMMNGDPSFGGRVDVMSQKTGLLGPQSWCYDSRGNIWLMGTSGLFVLPRGSMDLQDISRGRLDQVLRRVDLNSVEVKMVFDPVSDYVMIFFTRLEVGAADEHWIYDTRNDAIWPWVYPNVAGPIGICEPVSGDPEYRRPLLGGRDGRIRRHAKDATADAGGGGVPVLLPTRLRFTALEAQAGATEIMLQELQATASIPSAQVRWRAYSAPSREQLAQIITGDQNARALGFWFGDDLGFQPPVGVRIADGAVQLEISDADISSRWGIERIVAYARSTGRRR